jgi:hypothetical protein
MVFWVITRRRVVIIYRRFGTTCRSVRFLATPKDAYGFPQCLQETAWIVPRLSNDRFLPNPFQLFIH